MFYPSYLIPTWIGTQAPLTAFQVCGRHFFSTCHFPKILVVDNNLYFLAIFHDYIFSETPIRRGTQFHLEKWSNSLLNSRLVPIGDRNDIREFLLWFDMLGLILLFFFFFSPVSVPTQSVHTPAPSPPGHHGGRHTSILTQRDMIMMVAQNAQ